MKGSLKVDAGYFYPSTIRKGVKTCLDILRASHNSHILDTQNQPLQSLQSMYSLRSKGILNDLFRKEIIFIS